MNEIASNILSEIRVGDDDVIIYQKKYPPQIKTWFLGPSPPQWALTEPSELLKERGLPTENLHMDIKRINKASEMHFYSVYAFWHHSLFKILCLLLFICALILLAISDKMCRIFGVIMFCAVIVANMICVKYLKPVENAIYSALYAVGDYVDTMMNNRYQSSNIHWGSVSRGDKYKQIIVSCTDNVNLDENIKINVEIDQPNEENQEKKDEQKAVEVVFPTRKDTENDIQINEDFIERSSLEMKIR